MRDVYQEVTDKIIQTMEEGTVPWRNPVMGMDRIANPRSLATGKPYRGINVFLLAMQAMRSGYRSGYWLTFRQAAQMGGHVKKGESSSLVIFWKLLEKKDAETGEKKKLPVLRHFNVFNLDQINGIDLKAEDDMPDRIFNPIDAAEQVIEGYNNGPVTTHDGGHRAFYRPATDTIHLPKQDRFESDEEYYCTRFHEMIHSTGHSKRLDRKLDTAPKPFGSPDYSREELLAEMGAAFLSAHAGIAPVTLKNSTAYIRGWLKVLKNDKRLLIHAAGGGQRASDLILGQKNFEK